MKIIGILTYQNTFNFGAAYQCKALYQYIKNIETNHKVIVLDYINKAIFQKTDIASILKRNDIEKKDKIKNIIYAIVSFYLKKRFSKFFNDVNFSARFSYFSFDEIKNLCDYFVIGSDQLWNFELNGGDTNYLLPNIDKKKVFTYATSIGKKSVPNQFLEVFKNNLKDVEFISVREASAKKIISSILPTKKIEIVLDPVFLLDRSQWMTYLSHNIPKKGATFYLFHKEFLVKAKVIAGKLSICHSISHKICGGLSFKDFLNPKIKTGLLYGPQEVLNTIYYSEVVFTDSFHCVAMSIIFHVNFFVFLSGNPGSDSRIIQLLKLTGLMNHIVNNTCDFEALNVDWDKVDKRLQVMKTYSRKYLDKALNSFT